jgi:predicted ribosome quality control (RQC) complex YloA/Tae2 family protein
VILAGRSVTENLELTFKVARGNDLWFHVRGLKSAHVIVILPPKKTASLDTLLDAAQVCRVLSGYKNMGKIEVDYTQRKYVKRIKGSSLVSYTQNKTLVVENDIARIDRVFKTEF